MAGYKTWSPKAPGVCCVVAEEDLWFSSSSPAAEDFLFTEMFTGERNDAKKPPTFSLLFCDIFDDSPRGAFLSLTRSSSFIFSSASPSVSNKPVERNKFIGHEDASLLFSSVLFSTSVTTSSTVVLLLSFFPPLLLAHIARIFANELPLVMPQFSNCSSLKAYTLVPSLFSYKGLAHTELFFGRANDNIVNAKPNPSFACAATRTDVLVSTAAKSIAAVSEDTPINRALRPESNKFVIRASHGTAYTLYTTASLSSFVKTTTGAISFSSYTSSSSSSFFCFNKVSSSSTSSSSSAFTSKCNPHPLTNAYPTKTASLPSSLFNISRFLYPS